MVGPVPISRTSQLEALLLEDAPHHLLALGLLAEGGPAAFHACVQDGELVGVAYVGRDGLVVPAAVKSPGAARELGASLEHAHVRTVLGERSSVGGLLAGLNAPRLPGRNERLYAVTADDMGPYVTASLRPAEDGDVGALVELGQAYLEERRLPEPQGGLEAQTRARVAAGRVWVLHQDGALAFRVDLAAESRHGAHVDFAYTAPAFRRRGLAAQGMGQLARSLLARIPRLTVLAEDGDLAALGVVRKVGFGPALPWRRVDLPEDHGLEEVEADLLTELTSPE